MVLNRREWTPRLPERRALGGAWPEPREEDLMKRMFVGMLATALVGYKEYPHVDVMNRMLDLFAVLADTGHLWPLVEDPFAS